MPDRTNVLARVPRPTTKSYRSAIKSIVLNLQARHGLNDPELAERIGCSSGTVKNARTEATNLDGVTLANIEYEFGPSAIDPFMALGGSRCVPLHAVCNTDGNAELALIDALRAIIETQHPDSDGGPVTTQAEARQHIDKLRAARTVLDGLIALAEGPAVRAA